MRIEAEPVDDDALWDLRERKRRARQRLLQMMEERPLIVGERTWSREDLYRR